MSAITPSVRALIESSKPAHLVTLNADGSPQVTVVWVGLDGEEIVVGHLRDGQKVRNIRRDPRVVLSIESGQRNTWGLDEYLVLTGRARITDGGAPELLQQLARGYLGPEVTFPDMENPPRGSIIHISVERIGGVGPWQEEEA